MAKLAEGFRFHICQTQETMKSNIKLLLFKDYRFLEDCGRKNNVATRDILKRGSNKPNFVSVTATWFFNLKPVKPVLIVWHSFLWNGFDRHSLIVDCNVLDGCLHGSPWTIGVTNLKMHFSLNMNSFANRVEIVLVIWFTVRSCM